MAQACVEVPLGGRDTACESGAVAFDVRARGAWNVAQVDLVRVVEQRVQAVLRRCEAGRKHAVMCDGPACEHAGVSRCVGEGKGDVGGVGRDRGRRCLERRVPPCWRGVFDVGLRCRGLVDAAAVDQDRDGARCAAGGQRVSRVEQFGGGNVADCGVVPEQQPGCRVRGAVSRASGRRQQRLCCAEPCGQDDLLVAIGYGRHGEACKDGAVQWRACDPECGCCLVMHGGCGRGCGRTGVGRGNRSHVGAWRQGEDAGGAETRRAEPCGRRGRDGRR